MEHGARNMYHISNDLRAEKSAKRIGKGLLTCLQSKNLVEITVTDVQKEASVGRATFYRLFDNITDVLSYLCDNIFEEVGSEFERTDNRNPNETSLKFIQKLMNNKTLLKAIVDCNRMDILYNAHSKYLGKNMDFFFPDLHVSEEQTTYLMMTMTACTSACLVAWLKNGGYENAERLQNRLKNCFETLNGIFR